MTLTLTSSVSAMGPGLSTSFLGIGGTPSYVYSVIAGGAGGSINASTGQYLAPSSLSSNPAQAYDTIQVTDATSATATQKILIAPPLMLFCDILQNQLGLANDHIYLWDQKIMQPTDSSLYIAVAVLHSTPFGNTNFFNASGQSVQSVNMLDALTIDAISRGPAARDQRANIIMALNSNYAESQQELNSFRIGTLPAGGQFVNLSNIDGAAIPYRFQIQINLQYFVTNVQSVQYYTQFQNVSPVTES